MKTQHRGAVVTAAGLGEAWREIARLIREHGRESRYDSLPILELAHATIEVSDPDPEDPIIEALANPERLAWMHANFTDHSRVAELGDAVSYASRLFDYGRSGLDQLAWVIDRLKSNPSSRSASITTFEPLSDTSYVPCVSLLDFWIPDGSLELVAYCHSIDFGSKGYGNLVELAALQRQVSLALEIPVGRLTMIVKSAHLYETDMDYLNSVLTRSAATA